jgi:hypothetical protein
MFVRRQPLHNDPPPSLDTTIDKPRSPRPPPTVQHVVAVCLELGVFATFACERSIVGLVLCAAYFWFSATWSLLFCERDD